MRPTLMGIVNVTPDSFSDGGRYGDPDRAVAHALRLLDEGADWLDVGGESTRPGADPVAAEVETARVIPVVRGILERRPEAVVTVDTHKASVAALALEAGAAGINDVSALSDPEMAGVVSRTGARLVLMHMRGTPRSMQADTRYGDLVEEVRQYLSRRADLAMAAGIAGDRLLVDPGLGFGKAPRDNPLLISALPRIASLGFPVVIGASRKRFVGDLTGVEVPAERVHGSIGAALAAAARGASVLRVHDVRATRQALDVFLPSMGDA